MNIAICEDNAADAAQIRALLLEHFERNRFDGDIRLFESGEALLCAFSPGAFDAVFLDIYFEGMSGMEVAEKLREADPDFALVFITVSREHALEAFSVMADAYVVKPIESESIDAAFNRCRGVFMKNARYIEVTSGRGNIKIPHVKIHHIENRGHAAMIHTLDGIVHTYASMDELEQKLGGAPFLRCHRAYIVNMNLIEKVREHDIAMRGGGFVPVRKNGRREIRDAHMAYVTQRLFEL